MLWFHAALMVCVMCIGIEAWQKASDVVTPTSEQYQAMWLEERRQSPHIVIFHHDTNHKNIFPWIKSVHMKDQTSCSCLWASEESFKPIELASMYTSHKDNKATKTSSIPININWNFVACKHNQSKKLEVFKNLHFFLPGQKVWHKQHECHTTYGSKPTMH